MKNIKIGQAISDECQHKHKHIYIIDLTLTK